MIYRSFLTNTLATCPWCGTTLRPRDGPLWRTRGTIACNHCHELTCIAQNNKPALYDALSGEEQRTLREWLDACLEPADYPMCGSAAAIRDAYSQAVGHKVALGHVHGALLKKGFMLFSTADTAWHFSVRWKDDLPEYKTTTKSQGGHHDENE